MEDYKETVYKAFRKRKRMKLIIASPINQKLTQAFDAIIVQSCTTQGASFEKMLISQLDAEFYINVLDKAISQLPDTPQEPYGTIIRMKHIDRASRYEICREIKYELRTYQDKLRESQMELANVIDTWGLNID